MNKRKLYNPYQTGGVSRWLYGEFYQTLKEELITVSLKLYEKIEDEGKLQNSFSEARITLIPKQDKDNTEKKLWTNIPDKY